MAVFEYICDECGIRFERLAITAEVPAKMTCPNGHHKVRRIYSAPSVIYRGSGWYRKDHAKK